MPKDDSVARWTLRVAGGAGLALFLFFFALTFRVPQWVETFAKDFIEREVRHEVEARIDALGVNEPDSTAGRFAARLYEQNQQRIDDITARLKDRSRDLFLVALDQVRDLNCECRQRIEEAWRESNVAKLAGLLANNQRIQSFIHASYMDVANELRAEIRIFTATNAAAFLLLLGVSFAKPGAAKHLLVPGVLLLCATILCVCLYVFSQNWLLTIIHGDYVGFAYVGWLGAAFLLLLDIALNRGRVTAEIANGISGALGGVFSALTPC